MIRDSTIGESVQSRLILPIDLEFIMGLLRISMSAFDIRFHSIFDFICVGTGNKSLKSTSDSEVEGKILPPPIPANKK
jgi:hypothetical protein